MPKPIAINGLLLACDAQQEWILPWWWHYYAQANTLPVTFVDLGMSEEGKSWCCQRGELVALSAPFARGKEKESFPPRTIARWQQGFGEDFWPSRKAWFSKPFALLLTPYEKTLWLDLDCKVQCDLTALFKEESDLALCPWSSGKETVWREHGVFEDETLYNGGVILYRRKNPLIEAWAQEALVRSESFTTDDHLLSRIIYEKRASVLSLPSMYNAHYALGAIDGAQIVHYCGPGGKELIWQERSLFLQLSRELATRLP